MATATRAQVNARYQHLNRSASIVEPTTEHGKQLRDVALYTLNLYPIADESASSAGVTLPLLMR